MQGAFLSLQNFNCINHSFNKSRITCCLRHCNNVCARTGIKYVLRLSHRASGGNVCERDNVYYPKTGYIQYTITV